MKVLIALDESPCSSVALDYVLEQCWPHDAEFRIVSVVEPYYMQYAAECGYVGAVVQAQQELVKNCREMVAEKLTKLKQVLPEQKVSGTVLEGPPAVCILDLAESSPADLVVLGSHGRSGFQKFFLGSVAEKVARHAPCSVEVVKGAPPHEHEKESNTAVA